MAENKYVEALARAKERGEATAAIPPRGKGQVFGTDKPPPLKGLSPEVLDGMQAVLGQAKELSQKTSEAPKEEKPVAPPDDIPQLLSVAARRQREELLTRRTAIEEHLEPISLEDLLVNGFVTQDVPVTEGLVVTFRSIPGDEDAYLKQQISLADEQASETFLQTRFAHLILTAGLVSINGREFPIYLVENGSIDRKIFAEKHRRVTKIDSVVLAELHLQYSWFQSRIAERLTLGALKNG